MFLLSAKSSLGLKKKEAADIQGCQADDDDDTDWHRCSGLQRYSGTTRELESRLTVKPVSSEVKHPCSSGQTPGLCHQQMLPQSCILTRLCGWSYSSCFRPWRLLCTRRCPSACCLGGESRRKRITPAARPRFCSRKASAAKTRRRIVFGDVTKGPDDCRVSCILPPSCPLSRPRFSFSAESFLSWRLEPKYTEVQQ